MNGEFWLLATFFTIVVISILGAGYFFLKRAERTLSAEGPDAAPGSSLEEASLSSSHPILTRTFHAVGESVPASRRDNESLRKRLLMAGYRWPTAVAIFHGIRVASALGLAGLAGWTVLFLHGDSQSTLLPVICAAAFGYMVPDRILEARKRARGVRIRSGVPVAVDLLVLAIEAGQPLEQAMHDVATGLARCFPDLSEEFIFFHLEVRAGKSRQEALRHLSERSPDPELKKLVTVLLDGDRFGTSLGPALRNHARYLRVRMRHLAQEKARKLPVKLTIPTFFLIFPSVLVVTLGPAYLQLKENLARLLGGF